MSAKPIEAVSGAVPEASEADIAAERAKMPDVAHPLVRSHPDLGRDGLYLGCGDTERLFNDLLAHMIDTEFVQEHHWRTGDVLMADNWCSLHTGQQNGMKTTIFEACTVLS